MRQIKKPEEIIMLSKLKAIIAKANKTAVILAVMLVLSGISLNSYIYDDTIQVHINVDGMTVKTVNTKAGTVGDILANENISLEQGDVVKPQADTKLLTSGTVSVNKLKSITVYNGDSVHSVKTSAATAQELEKSGAVGLMPTDSVMVETERIADGGEYEVKNAFLINVHADSMTYPVYLSKGTVADAIKAAGVTMDADDLCYPLANVELWDGIEIRVTRVSTVHTTENAEIPYETEKIENKYLKPSEQVVTVEGAAGEKVINKVITYHNGAVYSEIVTENVVRPAVNKVVECGVWNLKRSGLNSAASIGTVNGKLRLITGKVARHHCVHREFDALFPCLGKRLGQKRVDQRVFAHRNIFFVFDLRKLAAEKVFRSGNIASLNTAEEHRIAVARVVAEDPFGLLLLP